MSDTVANYALNIMILTFDTFYLIRDEEIERSHDLEEFVLSDAGWVYDETKGGYTSPRTVLPVSLERRQNTQVTAAIDFTFTEAAPEGETRRKVR